jgi:hypothetical protein
LVFQPGWKMILRIAPGAGGSHKPSLEVRLFHPQYNAKLKM